MKKILLPTLLLAGVCARAQQVSVETNLAVKASSVVVESARCDDFSLLCDGDITTVGRLDIESTPAALVYQFENPHVMTGINLVAGGDLDKTPSRIMVYGRNSADDDWKTIARMQTVKFSATYQNCSGRPMSQTGYTQLKVEFARLNTDNVAELAELQLLGHPAESAALSTADNGSYSTAAGNVSYGGLGSGITLEKEYYDNGIIDDKAWQAYLQYDFNTPTAISGYRLGTGLIGSGSNRPAAWELLASEDGQEWVTLDMQANEPRMDIDNYARDFYCDRSGHNIDFGAVADEIHKMIDQRFYRDYAGGKYLLHSWSADPEKINYGYNYWWMAHAVDAYVDAYMRTGTNAYEAHARNIRTGMYVAYDAGRRDLWNSFYDDMEWMCIACIRASQNLRISTVTWLNEAKQLFNWIWEGWDEATGGILWNNGSQRGVIDSKNSCSNAPAMISAARLYQLTGDEQYLTKAKMIFDFMYEHNLFADGLVKDGPTNENRGWAFTYNQGTWVGGLMELYRITDDEKYRDIAVDLIDKCIDSRWYSPLGIMGESGKADGGLFKGIFIRYIAEWAASGLLDQEHTVRYANYLLENARSLCLSGLVRPDMVVMANWADRGEANLDTYDSSVVLSALFLLEAVDMLRREGVLNDNYTVKNDAWDKAYSHYRLKVTANHGGTKVDINSFELLGDEDLSGVSNVAMDAAADDAWYTLTGVRIAAPTTPGIYIHNKKKVIVR